MAEWWFGLAIGLTLGVAGTMTIVSIAEAAADRACTATCQSEVYAQRTDGACVCVGQEVSGISGEQP